MIVVSNPKAPLEVRSPAVIGTSTVAPGRELTVPAVTVTQDAAGRTLTGAETVWPSTVVLAPPEPGVVPVKVVPVTPLVVVPEGGATVPMDPANDAGVPFGIVPAPDVSSIFELIVSFDVTDDVDPTPILEGLAVVVRVSHGDASTVPTAEFAATGQPAPPAPGP